MGRLVIILFLIMFSYGSQILNISYFPTNSKVDVLFSLDNPFKGKISLIDKNNYKISGISFNRIEQKKFNQNLNIIISGVDNDNINIKIVSKYNIKIQPSVTAKGYGLRLRLTGIPKVVEQHKEEIVTKKFQTNNDRGFDFVNYIIVIIILLILMVILLIVKKKALQKLPNSFKDDKYNMLYQKYIDPKNRIVLIELFDKKYLLLLGDKNNVLLDNFSQTHQEDLQEISSQNGFDSLLETKLNEENFIEKASKLKEYE